MPLAFVLAIFAAGCVTGSPPPPLPPAAQGGAVIIVVKNKSSLTKLASIVANVYGDLRKLILSQDLGADAGIISFQDFAAGIIVHALPVPDEEVSHDPDKLDADLLEGKMPHEWSRFKIGGQLLFPIEFTLPGVPAPIGLSLGADFNIKRSYTLTLKTNELLEAHSTVLGDAWSRIAGSVESLGAIRIPFSPDALVAKYAPGSEISREGVQGVLTHVGVNAGSGVGVGGGADVFALITTNLESRIKVLHDVDKRLVRYSVKSLHEDGNGHEGGVTLGVTLFQTQLLSGILNVNLLASRTISTVDHSLIFDYTYDIGFPAAAKALEAALRGDLRPTQSIAIFRDDEDKYQGVIINAQKAIDVLTEARAHALGFSIDNSALNTTLGGIRLGEAFGGFLYNSTTTSSHNTTETQTDFQHESAKVDSLDFDAEHRELTFWGLLVDNRKKLHASAQIVQADATQPDGSTVTMAVPKVSFNYRSENRRDGRGVARDFFNSAVNMVAFADPTMNATIDTVFRAGHCEGRGAAVFELKGTLYDKAIGRVAAADEAVLWMTFGRMLGLDDPAKLADAATREVYARALDSDRRSAIKSFAKDFVPRWQELHAASDDKARMAAFHKLIAKYGLDTIAFETLVAMASMGADHSGVFAAVALKNEHCNFTWSQKGELEFNLADVSLDWNMR